MNPRLRPLQGKVLVKMDAQESEINGILIPEEAQEKSQTGRVIKCGIWRQFNDGSLRPFPVKRGDKVVINKRRGRWLHGEELRLKIVDMEDLLAVLGP